MSTCQICISARPGAPGRPSSRTRGPARLAAAAVLLALANVCTAFTRTAPVTVAPAAPATPPAAASGPLHLASLEWPPYSGESLPDHGLAAEVAMAAALAFGQPLQVTFFPWKRAMQVGGEDPDYAGYFPAYYTEERARECHFSQPIGRSVLGLATLRETPLHWERLADLGDARIGVVAGYSNGPEFDEMVREGRLQVDVSPGDASNLRKLLAGRVRAAAIDRAVMDFLLLSDPSLAAGRGRVVFGEHPIAQLSLHVCFRNTPLGLRQRQAFDAALKHLDLSRMESAYLERLARPAAGASQPK